MNYKHFGVKSCRSIRLSCTFNKMHKQKHQGINPGVLLAGEVGLEPTVS